MMRINKRNSKGTFKNFEEVKEDPCSTREELIQVDEECEVAALLIHVWVSAHITRTDPTPQREVRTANACMEHKLRHQRCPEDCLNRGKLGRNSDPNFEKQ